MIRLRDAAASLLDEPMRQVWKNLEWDMMVSMTTEGAEALRTEELDWLTDLQVWLVVQVLHLLRAGEWRCEGYRRGDFEATVLSASWWARQNFLDLWGETTRWDDEALTRLAIEVLAQEPPGTAPDNAPPLKRHREICLKGPHGASESPGACSTVRGSRRGAEARPSQSARWIGRRNWGTRGATRSPRIRCARLRRHYCLESRMRTALLALSPDKPR